MLAEEQLRFTEEVMLELGFEARIGAPWHLPQAVVPEDNYPESLFMS